MARPWTRLAKKQESFCAVCEEEFYAIRSDARFCRSEKGKMKRLKRLAKRQSIGTKTEEMLARKALEDRIAQALVNQDSDQLALALHEMRHAPFPSGKRRRFSPYGSFATYCRERWHLDPEKVARLINPFLNPVIMPELSRQRARRKQKTN